MKFKKEPKLKRAPKLSEQVASFLTDEIKNGAIQAGESLPSEAELSYRFSVSRTVIREALSKLKYDGILESKQGSRTKVSSGSTTFRLSPKATEPLLISQLYELKALIEGDATALASVRRSKKDIKDMEACLKILTKSLEEGIDSSSANVDFHQIIISASGNEHLVDLMNFINESIWNLIQSNEAMTGYLPMTSQSLKEHVAIFDAVFQKESDVARKTVHEHLKNSAKRRGIYIL